MSKHFILILFILNLYAVANDRLSDEADLFTDTQETSIEAFLDTKSLEGQIDLYLLTRATLQGDETRFAAEKFYVQEGRGLNNGGAVFIIDMERRDMGIYTFGPAITHFKNHIDPILDHIAPLLTAKRYDFAAREYASQMANVSSKNAYLLSAEKAFHTLIESVFSWVLIIGIPFIVVLVRSRQNKTPMEVTPKTYLVKDSFHLKQTEDKYLRTTESRVYDPPQKSSSGGGSSSGGSRGGGFSGGGSRKF